MGRKIRRQVTLDAEQDAALKLKARELGVSEAEVIRRGIEMVCSTPGNGGNPTAGAEHQQAANSEQPATATGRVLSPEEQQAWREQEEQFMAESKAMIAEKLRQHPDDADLAQRLTALEATLNSTHERFDPSVPQTDNKWSREEVYEDMYEQRFARLFG